MDLSSTLPHGLHRLADCCINSRLSEPRESGRSLLVQGFYHRDEHDGHVIPIAAMETMGCLAGWRVCMGSTSIVEAMAVRPIAGRIGRSPRPDTLGPTQNQSHREHALISWVDQRTMTFVDSRNLHAVPASEMIKVGAYAHLIALQQQVILSEAFIWQLG